MPKYEPLRERLARADGDAIELSFRMVDELVGGLPRSARHHRSWWGNESDPGRVHAAAWSAAGWMVDEVDLVAERVKFRRT